MTRDDIISLAEECGGENATGDLFYMTTTQLEMFADSVRLDEREACAKLCEMESVVLATRDQTRGALYCGGKIRARSKGE